MRQLWDWFGKNAANLRGVAALVVVISAVGGVLIYARKLVEPELTVIVHERSAAIPRDVAAWVGQALRDIDDLKLFTITNEPLPYSRLRALALTNQEEFIGFRMMDFGLTRVDLVNETDHVLPGVRMHFDYPAFWSASLQANFLTDQECVSWLKNLPPRGSLGMAFPEFPAIPPRSSLGLFIYCRGGTAHGMTVTVPGGRFKIVNAVEVEDRWPVSWALRPFVVTCLGLMSLVIGVPFVLVWYHNRVWVRAERAIPYDLACREAKAGRKERALTLLSTAVAAGFDNFEFMRRDPDLEILHGNSKFEALLQPETPGDKKTE